MEDQSTTYQYAAEKRSLLSSDVEESREICENDRPRDLRHRTPLRHVSSPSIHLILHAIIASIWIGASFLLFSTRKWECAPGPSLIHSPAREAVRYEKWAMNNTLEEKNKFKGTTPSLEQTSAWGELLKWQVIKVSEDDVRALGRLNENTAKFSDGSGYFAELDVYHQVHCLNYIREFIHRDYYENVESLEMQAIHVDHCIDALRQIAMCHADISIVTYEWREDRLFPFPIFNVERECRNWDNIENWVKAHQPNFDYGEDLLVNPQLGNVPIYNPFTEKPLFE